ncbi:hypothetical protein [Acinetobacter bereziniae]|uniref:hypothetical protein n=1 Tax=Acinetobacter bereziniae TaxID=106648 RepID=UPI00125063A2|nr:hypothetical protein [Acinetobacter bereziniae]
MKKFIFSCFLITVTSIQHAKNLIITLDLYDTSGTLSQQQKNEMLNIPIEGYAVYHPNYSVLGLTGTVKKCGFLGLPCIEKKYKQLKITAIKTNNSNTLTFDVPLSIAAIYKLKNFNVSFPFQTRSLGSLQIRTAASEHSRLVQPVSINNGYQGVYGTLTLNQLGFTIGDQVLGALNPDQPPPYQFFKTHKYRGYFDNQNIRAIPNYISSDLKSPYPAEIANLEKIYSAKRFDAQLDGHQFTAVDISAKQKKNPKCKSTFGDYKYTLFFIDGQLSYYSTTLADMETCETRYTTAVWNEYGEVYDYQVHKSSSAQPFQYRGWRNTCNIENNSNIGFCNIQPPNQEALKHFEKEANRVLHFFPTP